jgi:hypothetical protein
MPIRFLPVFWSLELVPAKPGVMGILCDPKHPALAAFPTGPGTSFQWWMLEGSRAFVLNDTPATFRSAGAGDRRLPPQSQASGAVIEAKVGRIGCQRRRSIWPPVSTGNRPAARALWHSLLR